MITVAEHTFYLILTLAKRVEISIQPFGWKLGIMYSQGSELFGKNLTVGFGRIGKKSVNEL